MPYSDQPTVTASGVEIPLLGFGTWQLEAEDARRMVHEALRIGYRHIDTAWIYKNEKAVGDGIADAVAEGIVAREEIFVTTKIWVEHFHRDALLHQAEESALSLGLTPDLLLLHWPKPTPSLKETIDALNEAQDKGFTKHIGLSNFPSAQFREAANLSKAPLVTNQVEISPIYQPAILDGTLDQCQQLRIKPMAWSCLGGGRLFSDAEFQPLRDELQTVAQEIGAETIEQVVYAWVMRLPSSPLPIIGSGKIERVRSALKAQELTLSRQQWFRIRKAALGYDVP